MRLLDALFFPTLLAWLLGVFVNFSVIKSNKLIKLNKVAAGPAPLGPLSLHRILFILRKIQQTRREVWPISGTLEIALWTPSMEFGKFAQQVGNPPLSLLPDLETFATTFLRT